MMNKKMLILMVPVMVILIAIGISTAYFTTEKKVNARVTASDLKVELLMTELDENNKEVPAKDDIVVAPGEEASRICKVKNTGKEPAWVRVKVEKGDTELTGIDDKKWTEKDGFWYYSEKLGPGETTAPLFTGVAMDPGIGNERSGEKVGLSVSAYGTQVAHNGSTALEAKGWPEA